MGTYIIYFQQYYITKHVKNRIKRIYIFKSNYRSSGNITLVLCRYETFLQASLGVVTVTLT